MDNSNQQDIDFVQYFKQRRDKDLAKHGRDSTAAGLRNTREIAEYYGLSLARIRTALSPLVAKGVVTQYAPIDGRTNIWGLTEYSQDATVGNASAGASIKQ